MHKYLLFISLILPCLSSTAQITEIDSRFHNQLISDWETCKTISGGAQIFDKNYTSNYFVGYPISKTVLPVSYQGMKFSFKNEEIELPVPLIVPNIAFNSPVESEVGAAFKKLVSVNFAKTIISLNEYKQDNYLDDFSFYLLVRNLSNKVYTDSNSSNIFTWFCLVKSGYNARIGFNNGRALVMLPLNVTDINAGDEVVSFNGKAYWIPGYTKGDVKSYTEQYPLAYASFTVLPTLAETLRNEVVEKKPSFFNALLNETHLMEKQKIIEQFYHDNMTPISTEQNVSFGGDGQVFCSGYFYGEYVINGKTYEGGHSQYTSIIAGYINGSVSWVKHLYADGNNIPLNVRAIGNDIVAIGVFVGDLKEQSSETPSLFFETFNKNNGEGKFLRLNLNDEIVSLESNTALAVIISPSGVVLFEQRVQTTSDLYSSASGENQNGNLVFTVSKEYTIGIGQPYTLNKWSPWGDDVEMVTKSSSSNDDPDPKKISARIYNKFSECLKMKYDKGIAGLIAAIEIFQIEKLMTGKTAQTTFQTYNPTFKTKSPNIYSGIGELNLSKNAQDEVVVLTVGSKKVQIGEKLIVENGAVFKIIKTATNDFEIKVIKGIIAVDGFMKVGINTLKLNHLTGDLTLDVKLVGKKVVNINDIIN